MEHWGADFNSTMFTKIKYRFKAKLPAKYNNINIVRNDKPASLTKFPTVFIPDPDQSATGYTFDTTIPNAYNCMYQPEIYAKTSDEAEELANKMEEVFCGMHFRVMTANRDMDSGKNDIYRRVGRYQRIIGANDEI